MNNFFKVLFLATILTSMCDKMVSEARVLFEDPEMRASFEKKLETDGSFRNFLKDRFVKLMAKYEDIPTEPRWSAESNNCRWNDVECLSGKGKKSLNLGDRDRKKNNMLTR